MHKGPKPESQPRSLRSIAESQNEAKNFVTEKMPAETMVEYEDPGEAAKSPPQFAKQAPRGGPQPFANVKKIGR